MTVRLRAHHLLCMLTYVGRGYTPAFVANYDAVIVRLASGEPIALIDGPDEICGPIAGLAGAHCHNESVVERDRLARTACTDLLGIDPAQDFRLDGVVLGRMRAAFASGASRAACTGCEWSGLCDHVAASGYAEVSLSFPPC